MKYTDYLRWGVIAGIFLVPFIPFLVANGSLLPNLFFPFITGKNFVFRILVELMLLCYVLLALREPKYRPRGSMLMWAALAFVGWMGIATFFSVDPLKSFWGNFERMEGYVALVHLLAWFIVTGAVLSAEKLWERFFNVSISLSVIQGCMALFQVLGWFGFEPSSQSGARADTTFGNATYLAVYMLIHFFLTLYMLARAKRSSGMQWLYGVALVLQFAGLYFTETRGALLGVVGGLIVAALWVAIRGGAKESQTLRKWSFAVLGLIAVLGVGFLAIRNTSLVERSSTLNRLASISLTDPTTQSRFLIWDMARQGAMEKPFFGWGQENFSYVFNAHYSPQMYNQEQWFDRAHNQFLDWLIAGGVLAFLLHISLYVLAAWAVWRAGLSVAEQAALFGFLAAYSFNNLFVFDNLVSAMFFWAFLAYMHSLTRRDVPSLALSRPVGDHTLAIAAPIVAAILLVGGWALNAPSFSRASALVDALQTQQAVRNQSGVVVAADRPVSENLAAFDRALHDTAWPGTPLGEQETIEQLFQFAVTRIAPNTSIDPQVRENTFRLGFEAGSAFMQQRKGDARMELFMANFLGQFGQTAEALKHMEEALRLSPNKQQILIQLGGVLLGSEATKEDGLAAFKKAYEVETRNTQALYYYAAALQYAGRAAEGDALLMERFGTTAIDNDDVLQLYMNLKLFDRAAAIWQVRIEKDPTNAEMRLGLASTYFNACRIPAAVAELKKIIAAAPATAAEIQPIITQLENGTLPCPK